MRVTSRPRRATPPAAGWGERALWSVYARLYDAVWDAPLADAVASRVADALAPGVALLDVGCGTGLHARVLTGRGHEVVGIDPSQAMVRRARRTGRLTRAVCGHVGDEAARRASAPAVLCANALHLARRPAELVAGVVRAAASGATIVWVTPTDAATYAGLRAADRSTGRSVAGAALADAGRRVVGLVAGATGIAPLPSAAVRALLDEQIEAGVLTLVDEAVVADVQRVIVTTRA